MARLRTIKSEFWTSEQIVSCSRDARLLFIGLWNFCDDAGIHTASFVRLKMETLSADNAIENDIKTWIEELIKNGLIIEFEVGGKKFWQVTGWKQHQKIDRPTYRHPNPPQNDTTVSPMPPLRLNEGSSIAHQPLTESSTRNRVEQSRVEKEDISEVKTSPLTDGEKNCLRNTHLNCAEREDNVSDTVLYLCLRKIHSLMHLLTPLKMILIKRYCLNLTIIFNRAGKLIKFLGAGNL